MKDLSGNKDRNTTNTPIKDKTKQNNDFNLNNSNWQIAHSTKSSNQQQINSIADGKYRGFHKMLFPAFLLVFKL